MKSSFLAIAALMLCAPGLAFAEQERMSDARYIAAAQCVAYAELPQLSEDVFSVASLKQQMEHQNISIYADNRASENARSTRLADRRAGDNAHEIDGLRIRRDNACANFVASGLVQAGPVTPAS